jgi:uncharacterized lipoprotein YmbA
VSDLGLKVTISATAEVRDKDGNLLSSSPVELTGHLTQEQYDEIARQQEES